MELRLAAAVVAACSSLQGLVHCLAVGSPLATGVTQQPQQQQQERPATLVLLAAAVQHCLAGHCLVVGHCWVLVQGMAVAVVRQAAQTACCSNSSRLWAAATSSNSKGLVAWVPCLVDGGSSSSKVRAACWVPLLASNSSSSSEGCLAA
jgi:hypothetical protein